MKYLPGWRDKTKEIVRYEQNQRRIQFLQILLPSLVMLMVLAVIAWPMAVKWKKSISQNQTKKRRLHTHDIKNKIFDPHYHSIDKQGKPIDLFAKIALQIAPNIIHFDKPRGKLYMNDGTWLTFNSLKGIHYKEDNILDLTQEVHLVTENGYDIVTQSARIFLTQKKGSGQEEVNGTGPVGETIKAEGFVLTNAEKKITFTGKTSIVYPSG